MIGPVQTNGERVERGRELDKKPMVLFPPHKLYTVTS